MEHKKIDLILNENIPTTIDLSRGNITILADQKQCFAELEYSNFESIVPEVIIKQENKNIISFKNTEIISTNVYFYLPLNLKNIEIHTINGDIIINGMNSDLNLQTDKGDIKIKSCKGKLNAAAFGGNIKIHGFDGEINLNAPNGSVKILDYQSTGGNIQTNAGSIIIGLKKITKDFTAQSNYGKVNIGLSKNNPCTIIARGTDVIKYADNNIKGESLGSPAEIKWAGGGNNIQLFSSNNKVIVSTIDYLSEVAPDFEDIFKEFESGFKDLSKNMEKWGKSFAQSFQKLFSDFDNSNNKKEKKESDSAKSERMEILNMLKEGKITAEEAEKLLKALK